MDIDVRNIFEAADYCLEYDAVISVVDRGTKFEWTHSNHHVEYFWDDEDPQYPDSPTKEQVERILEFVKGLDPDSRVLVHCWMGQSRSTATAVGILMADGMELEKALEVMADKHPANRKFDPNVLVLKHVGELLGVPDVELRWLIWSQDNVSWGAHPEDKLWTP